MTSPQARPGELLAALHDVQEGRGYVGREGAAEAARRAKVPVARAWEALTSYPDFAMEPPTAGERVCTGFACTLAGASAGPGQVGVGCQFRCFEAPAPGYDATFPEEAIRVAGPLLAPDPGDWQALDGARARGREGIIETVAQSGLRGRGGAYFPTGRKWAAALSAGRPIALVVNAEEGEPGVFKDRALLSRRPRLFVEGLAIAIEALAPAVTIIFINGEARAAMASLEAALREHAGRLPQQPHIVAGGGGYVLGEETTLLNAIEGRKPVPRIRPPYPVDSGLWGMPTVINNVETIASLAVLFREGADAFRSRGTAEAPGTKLLSVSGAVAKPGLFELPIGVTIAEVLRLAGGPRGNGVEGVLAGGPSGGLLPAALFDTPLVPGPLHPTGASLGAGGLLFLGSKEDVRQAALAASAFNAAESCGKCTPCREGTPRAHRMLTEGRLEGLDDLLEVIGTASLCGLGQMAPGPIRSALHFWPELFR